MPDIPSLAVIGAGVMGRRHVDAIVATGGAARLHAVVDPADAAKGYAAELGVAWYPDPAAMIAGGRPDGAIIASPNHLHVEHGMDCTKAGIPVLVEKPISSSVRSARHLVEEAERTGVPLLVGHHRRHNPLIAAAKRALESGRIGAVVAVHAMFWLYKPDDYFAVEWRHLPGAGPVFVNLIHDIDLLRHLCGEIASVQALQSNRTRMSQNEDTMVILLRFAGGALGTVNMSDTVVAPWSWELTAKENPVYPPTDQSCYLIGGTDGSLELPGLRIWSGRGGGKSWTDELACDVLDVPGEDPLVRQIRQFLAAIRGEEPPLVPGREGLRTLEAIEAIKRSAEAGAPIDLAEA